MSRAHWRYPPRHKDAILRENICFILGWCHSWEQAALLCLPLSPGELCYLRSPANRGLHHKHSLPAAGKLKQSEGIADYQEPERSACWGSLLKKLLQDLQVPFFGTFCLLFRFLICPLLRIHLLIQRELTHTPVWISERLSNLNGTLPVQFNAVCYNNKFVIIIFISAFCCPSDCWISSSCLCLHLWPWSSTCEPGSGHQRGNAGNVSRWLFCGFCHSETITVWRLLLLQRCYSDLISFASLLYNHL